MSTNSCDDRWLLPRRQTEYPARDRLPEETLHGRREATFLALAATFLVATAALIVLGTSRVVDVPALLARNGAGELPVALLVPLGAVPFAASFVASALACELFGRRRASALVWAGLVASLALGGLMRAADVIDGGDAFGVSLALAAGYLLAHVTNLGAFDALRRARAGRFVRITIAAAVANVIGWSAFAIVLKVGAGYIVAPLARETIVALALGAAAGSFAAVLVLAVPAVVVARGLAIALRVGPDPLGDDDDADYGDDARVDLGAPAWLPAQSGFANGSVARKLPRAVIVEEEEEEAHIKPFTSAEMRFFSEGDAVAD
jgi:uncharacterized PurR-regulated membrane protein YhhQ (DUF165 family)